MLAHITKSLFFIRMPFCAKNREFRVNLKKLKEPTYFMEVINNHQNLKETNRLLKSIKTGGNGINKSNFQNIFKKYIYYVEKVQKSEEYRTSKMHEKIQFLQNITEIYQKLGKFSGVNLVKAFNRISNELMESVQLPLIQKIQVILCISRYNKKKAQAIYLSKLKHLNKPSFIQSISHDKAISLLHLFTNIQIFNRLMIQGCIDALYNNVDYLQRPTLSIILYSLAGSHYPINKLFVHKIIKRIQDLLKNCSDTNSNSIRQKLNILNSLAIIQKNMNLSSAYLPQLDHLFEVHLQLFIKNLSHMKNNEIINFSNFLRRISHYDETALKTLSEEVMNREIQELVNPSQQLNSQNKNKTLSLNGLCAVLHTFAMYNFRNKKFLNYAVKVLNIAFSTQECKKRISLKYYSRAIWSICVLGTKQQLTQLYSIFQEFFKIQTHKIYDTLNFYYFYLLLKTYFPQITISLDLIQKQISDNPNAMLLSMISKTHMEIFTLFIQCGIPCLKEYNISNLMCDIFIPHYRSPKTQKQITNLIVDVHGFYHFMRNCNKLNGGSILKKKILQSEGYIYQYIAVDEWQMVEDKAQFLYSFLETITAKYGKQSKNPLQ